MCLLLEWKCGLFAWMNWNSESCVNLHSFHCFSSFTQINHTFTQVTNTCYHMGYLYSISPCENVTLASMFVSSVLSNYYYAKTWTHTHTHTHIHTSLSYSLLFLSAPLFTYIHAHTLSPPPLHHSCSLHSLSHSHSTVVRQLKHSGSTFTSGWRL